MPARSAPCPPPAHPGALGLTGEVGYQHSTSALTGGGTRANPFFNQLGGDTRVYLGASFQLDNLVKAIQGGNDGEAGIVRAKAKSPVLAF